MKLFAKENIQNIYPLSPIQEGMFFEFLLNENKQAYIQQVTFDFCGDFNNKKFEQALQHLVLRHDILRTIFTNKKEDQPLQIVLKQYPPDYKFNEILLSDEVIVIENETERKKIFDLFKGPLFRTRVYKKSNKVYKVAFTFHHILLDGWSFFKLLNELMYLYTNEKGNLPTPKPFKDFIKELSLIDSKKADKYWSTYLEKYEYPVQIPLKNEDINLKFLRCVEELHLDNNISFLIQQYIKKHRITGYNLFATVWGYLLTRFNDVEEAVFGIVTSGREARLMDIIGITINTLPFRIQFTKNITFPELVREIQERFSESVEYVHTPLSKIQSFSTVKHQLFDHIFVYENIDWEDVNTENESTNSGHITNFQNLEHTHYNFEVAVYPGKEMLVKFIYNGNKVDEHFVTVISREFKTLLTTIINNPKLKVGEIMTFLEEKVPPIPVEIEDF